MVQLLVLPMGNDVGPGEIPGSILERIAENIQNLNDLVNFSLINKHTYNAVMNNHGLWVQKLKTLGTWSDHDNDKLVRNDVEEAKLTPLNCFTFKISDVNISRVVFISIYKQMAPILKQLLIDNNVDIQNVDIFNQYSTPISQAKLFTSISIFLKLYLDDDEYSTYIMRFNTILNLFVSSLIKEIDLQLKDEKYEVVLNLITALDYLNIDHEKITIDPLESLLEYFIDKYNEEYIRLLNEDDFQNQWFIKENENAAPKRGIVKGYSFDFDKIDEMLDQVKILLDRQLNQVNMIFRSDRDNKIIGRNIDEIPIILKIIENFLSNYLIGGLFDRIISKSRQIDSLDDIVNPQFYQSQQNNSETTPTLQDEDHNDATNPFINITNEKSLFFQCVPYIYSRCISTLQNLKYPNTEIIQDSNEKTSMDYIRIVCGFVNYYYEQYLIDFSNELPKQCHLSLIQLINAWQTNNQKVQRNVENEILKLVDEDDNDNKKSNFEIFNAFTNLFTFRSKDLKKSELDKGIEDESEIGKGGETERKSDGENEKVEEVKLTHMAAKLKILAGKVENLKSLVSLDLTIILLQHIKNSYDLLIGLTKYSTTQQLNKQIHQTCMNIYSDMLNLLINNHIKPGFLEALERLKNYKPVNITKDGNSKPIMGNQTVEPVNNFIELVDVGDLILQMINVFYEHELVDTGIIPSSNQYSRDFLRMNNVEKLIKLLESTLDKYVANGLDISIDIIISEIRFKVEECVGPIPLNNKSKSNTSTISSRQIAPASTTVVVSSAPSSSASASLRTASSHSTTLACNIAHSSSVYNIETIEMLPLNEGHTSEWCNICLNVLKSHFSLLQDSIDKSIMDVFKQELGDRLITLLIQLLMKKFQISTIGGIQFSYDINSLYGYYQENRIKPAIEYLIGFKKIDQLYLVDCSSRSSSEFKAQCKSLGKLIIDVGRDNGVFTPEEVYQFVSRRTDWDRIKRNIDKVVYGLGADDCVIM
ncbi:uncharacterized protein C5L36_0A09230 [Pichia kudriavzevii]|uniref:Exocyst complex component Sec10-like alpha-helical bundle domain-containing protein n=1 Tax=Pichia kudriavzevii TaxID=4909 RepID=A0A2U9QZG3_PICKU|nr:uncharacterized protein C5L36_0A09230 [Pichia kudriavzevii]AWU74329.1 hypothetical protein C5L36_0A09230 [Pichia kudriavzevii]